MQLRIVYSSATHEQYFQGGGSIGTADFTNQALDNLAEIQTLHTPQAVLDSVAANDAQLAAVLVGAAGMWTSKTMPYEMGPFGVLGTGLMPDGSQFIELDIELFIDRTFDEWQWYVDNDPTSADLPAGFNAGWMARRSDVKTFKNTPSNVQVVIKNPLFIYKPTDTYDGEMASINWNDTGLYYIYGWPTVVDAWIYDLNGGALLATDANMTYSTEDVLDYIAAARPCRQFELYAYTLGGGAAQKFWTNFVSCVEDV